MKQLITILILLNSLFVFSQNDTIKNDNIKNYTFPKNILFFELKGATNYYSLNYERSLLSINNNNISLRVGICVIPIQGYAYISPITINYKVLLSRRIIANIGFTYNIFYDNKYYYNYALELGVLYKFYKSLHPLIQLLK